MSYLSLISCTDRGMLWVATRIRSAYSSVSKRETSFSRIALDSAVDTNRSIYPVLEFDTCRVAIANPVAQRKSESHNRPQLRLGHSGGPVPGHVEQLRVGLRPVQDHGAVDDVQMKHDAREVLEFRCGGALRGDEPDEHVFRSADRREDSGHLLQDFLLVHGLEGVEGHEGQERPLRLREVEFHVRPFRSESTFVPSMWRTVLETSAEPNVADSNTGTWFSKAPEGRWGLISSRRKSALPFRGGTCATPRPRATKLQIIAVRSQSM